jgi:hypothetical protein
LHSAGERRAWDRLQRWNVSSAWARSNGSVSTQRWGTAGVGSPAALDAPWLVCSERTAASSGSVSTQRWGTAGMGSHAVLELVICMGAVERQCVDAALGNGGRRIACSAGHTMACLLRTNGSVFGQCGDAALGNGGHGIACSAGVCLFWMSGSVLPASVSCVATQQWGTAGVGSHGALRASWLVCSANGSVFGQCGDAALGNAGVGSHGALGFVCSG